MVCLQWARSRSQRVEYRSRVLSRRIQQGHWRDRGAPLSRARTCPTGFSTSFSNVRVRRADATFRPDTLPVLQYFFCFVLTLLNEGP